MFEGGTAIMSEQTTKKEQLNEGKMMKALEWAYEKALDPGVPGIDSAYDMANDHKANQCKIEDGVNSLIRWQNAKAATSGFLSGLGGLITLPLAVPANISSVLFVQIRMIAAIAIMGGYDVKNDKVRTLIYASMCGNAAKEILKKAGVQVGKKLSMQVIKNISGAVLTKINQKVGFRLITKFGEKGVVNLGKAVPFVGGIVGATIDAVSTNTVGNVARNVFVGNNTEPSTTFSKAS
jgi:uncharacterized protein (DUF697 family)